VLGGVATAPWRSTAAEDVLRGRTVGEEAFAAAAKAAMEGAVTRPDNAYKVPLAERVLMRALTEAAAR
jgi:xanthine dehydrogenase YagS FAD-binding subunit